MKIFIIDFNIDEISVSIIVKSFPQCLFIAWRIILNNFKRILRVDFVNVLSKLASRLSLNLLDFFKASRLNE